jgi:hypothetical protein
VSSLHSQKISTSKPLKACPGKFQILSCDTVVANERYMYLFHYYLCKTPACFSHILWPQTVTRICSRFTTIVMYYMYLFVFLALQPIVVVFSTARQWALASSFSRSLDHTQRRATFGRTPLDEWSIRRRDLYLAKHNTHNRQTPMPSVGFESTISAGERPKTYALDSTATGTDNSIHIISYKLVGCILIAIFTSDVNQSLTCFGTS